MVHIAPSWCNKNMDGARGIKCGTIESRLEQYHHLGTTITCMAQQANAWRNIILHGAAGVPHGARRILHGATGVPHGTRGIPHGARGSIFVQEGIPLAQKHPSWPKSSVHGITRSRCCSISLPIASNLFQVLQTLFCTILSFST